MFRHLCSGARRNESRRRRDVECSRAVPPGADHVDDRLIDETAQLIADLRARPEGQEGLAAFFEMLGS